MNKSQRGFTLLEILFAVSLISIIGLALYSNLDSGIRMMKRISGGLYEEDLSVFSERLTRELQNSFQYTGLPFEGKENQFIFAGLFRADPLLGGETAVGRITYFYDSSSRSIQRRYENVSQIYTEDEKVKSLVALPKVLSLQVRYYGYEASQSIYQWENEWDSAQKENKIPLAVQLKFRVEENEKHYDITRTIAIPSATIK